MSVNRPYYLQVSALADLGQVRDHQEDSFSVNMGVKEAAWLPDTLQEGMSGAYGSLFLVADGMGGMNAGEVASHLAIQGVQQYFEGLNDPERLADEVFVEEWLLNAFPAANSLIYNSAKEGQEGMGTTLVIAWIVGNTCYVGWVGDSRCYLYRPGKPLYALSKDHSYVQGLVDEGSITEEEAFHHPRKNIITQSLGGHTPTIDPEVLCVGLFPGDRLLLCTDGLNGMLKDKQIEALLEQSPDCQSCASELIQQANQAGGHDNITVVVVDVFEDESSARRPAILAPEHAPAEAPAFNEFAERMVVPTVKAKAKQGFSKLLWLTPLILLIGVFVLWDKITPKDETAPLLVSSTTDQAEQAELADTMQTQSEQADTITYYRLVLGSYKEPENAEKKRNAFQQLYPDQRVVISEKRGGSRYEVSLDSFPSLDSITSFQNRDTLGLKDARVREHMPLSSEKTE
jgi:serine/threonine protein phosphatase PrpC